MAGRLKNNYKAAFQTGTLFTWFRLPFNTKRTAQRRSRLFMRIKKEVEGIETEVKVFREETSEVVSHFVWRNDKIVDIGNG